MWVGTALEHRRGAAGLSFAARSYRPPPFLSFKTLQGNSKVTLGVKRYPQDTQTNTALSPFTITSSTLKKDTRARGRYINVKIENDAASEKWRFGTLKLDVQPDGRR